MSLLTYQDARPWARSIKQKVVVARDAAVVHRPPRRHQQVQGRSVADRRRDRRHHASGSIRARRPGIRPTCRWRASFSDVDKWHIGKPDMIVTLPKPYELRANGPDEFYDVDVDPGFTEDMYIAAVETKPEPYSFKVVHHATANMIEDEEDDPVGFFFNEYALGKNGDIFPRRLGPPDQGRLEDPFQPAPASERRAIAGEPVDRLQAVSRKGRCRSTSRSRSTWATTRISTSRPGRSCAPTATSGCRARRCSRRSSRTCTTAARRCAWRRSIPDIRADSARPGPGAHRDAQLRQQLPVRLAHHLSVRRRRRADAAGRHDHPHHRRGTTTRRRTSTTRTRATGSATVSGRSTR